MNTIDFVVCCTRIKNVTALGYSAVNTLAQHGEIQRKKDIDV